MKTITFYSYKGGVGRSLALANIATRLVEFNKKVCLLDFDLEAPGLHLKFSSDTKSLKIERGIVDYIYQFSNEKKLVGTINDFAISFPIVPKKADITLIPAGNSETNEYWKKLSSINWYSLLYDSYDGLAFFIDLKEKIRREINPDYLIIDSRTGVSEMSGITTSVFADELVVVAANNKENLTGAKRIIKGITDVENSILGTVPKIHFVLSRIPFTNNPQDKAKEQTLVERVKKEFNTVYSDNIIVLHSDRGLEEKEELKIKNQNAIGDTSSSITNDYLSLFEKLTVNDLTKEEIKKFQDIQEAERLYQLALSIKDSKRKIELLNSAIHLNPDNLDYVTTRGSAFERLKEYDNAIRDFNSVLKIDLSNYYALSSLGHVYFALKDYGKALSYYEKTIETYETASGYFNLGLTCGRMGERENELKFYFKALEVNPDNDEVLNNLANCFKEEKNYQKASEYIYRALSINPNSGVAYATLAEINAEMGDVNSFYLHFELALINDKRKEVVDFIIEEEVYRLFFEDERFRKLLEKYDVPLHLLDSQKNQVVE